MPQIKKRGKAVSAEIKNKKSNLNANIHNNISDPSELSGSIIIHLKPSLKNNNFEDDSNLLLSNLKYEPTINIPKAYDSKSQSYCIIEKNIEDNSNNQSQDNIQIDKIYTADSIWCWWCCHPFQGKKLELPLHIKHDGSLDCIGSFCSPECVCAYSMESGAKYGDQWEQIELLHSIVKPTCKIIPAPHREELNVFGGKMSINEFRSKKSQTIIIYPPMVSLKLQMDDLPVEKNIQRSTDQFLNIDSLVLLAVLVQTIVF